MKCLLFNELCCYVVTVRYKDYKLNHATLHHQVTPCMLLSLSLIQLCNVTYADRRISVSIAVTVVVSSMKEIQ